jgi:hypothetical protein
MCPKSQACQNSSFYLSKFVQRLVWPHHGWLLGDCVPRSGSGGRAIASALGARCHPLVSQSVASPPLRLVRPSFSDRYDSCTNLFRALSRILRDFRKGPPSSAGSTLVRRWSSWTSNDWPISVGWTAVGSSPTTRTTLPDLWRTLAESHSLTLSPKTGSRWTGWFLE